MISKWYISTLIAVLAFIGLNQEQTKVANQQIVLQFADEEVTSVASHDNALATITKKLQVLGVSSIEVIENNDTKFTIRYFSDIDVLSVREFLSHNSELELSHRNTGEFPVDFPKDELPETCSLVVSDIHKQIDNGLGLHGKLAFELKQDYNRFPYPLVILFNDALALEQNASVQLAYRLHASIAIAIDNTSKTIPEVRAGPYYV